MQNPSGRVLFYSHDAHGLGHLRMTLLLATELARRDPSLAIFIASGAQSIDTTRLPGTIEIVKLPSIRAALLAPDIRPLAESGYGWRGVLAMREAMLADIVRTLDPHLFVGDNEPAGFSGELARALNIASANGPRATTVLGMNDTLGDGAAVVARWRRDHSDESLERNYDRVLIFGQPEIFDPRAEYAFSDQLAGEARFAGYLWPGKSGYDPSETRKQYGIGLRDQLAVATVGGGEDGFDVLRTAVRVVCDRFPKVRLVVVTGPLMNESRRAELAGSAGHAIVLDSVESVLALYESADAVITLGGYNSVVEVIGAGKRPIIVPRDDQWTEQRVRAMRMAELGLATAILPSQMTDETLGNAIETELASQISPPRLLELDGVSRSVDELEQLIPAPEERWPPRALRASPHSRQPRAAIQQFGPDDMIVEAWDGTRFVVRTSDLIESSIVEHGGFERQLQQLLLPWLRPGDIVIDAGANIGSHACPMAIRVAPEGFVIAIEPVPRIADRLETNAALNGIGNLFVERVAISSEPTRKALVVQSPDEANQGIASFHRLPDAATELLTLETTTIDAIVAKYELASLRILKLDLEGHDFDAMLGGRQTIARYRPIIAFEYHPALWAEAGRSLSDAIMFLADLGYRLSPRVGADDIQEIIAWP